MAHQASGFQMNIGGVCVGGGRVDSLNNDSNFHAIYSRCDGLNDNGVGDQSPLLWPGYPWAAKSGKYLDRDT